MKDKKHLLRRAIQKLKNDLFHFGWKVALFGTAEGILELSSGECIKLSRQPVSIPYAKLKKGFTIRSCAGKLADSMDSFVYCYTEVFSAIAGFTFSAEMTVQESERIPDYQTGYGICALDLIGGRSKTDRERNQLLVGRARFQGGLQHAAGVRVVSGYHRQRRKGNALFSAAKTWEKTDRILDASRMFENQRPTDTLIPGETDRFELRKTWSGFTAEQKTSPYRGDDTEADVISVPGCDFLLRQEPSRIAVGILAAGKIDLRVDRLSFRIKPGRNSHTPEGVFQNRIAQYPFESDQISEYKSCLEELPWVRDESGAYVLPNGTYFPEHPMISAEPGLCLKAENPGGAVIDGSHISKKLPLLMLLGDRISLEGFTIQNSLSSGIYITGNQNEVRDCKFRYNGDTGLLICSFPGADRSEWPSRNKVIRCESYDNCDPVHCNADGFGAKLRVGSGNRFEFCTAHHNADDGFDLYTKIGFGAIEPVILDHCAAYENGRLSDGTVVRDKKGSGFKLGGEQISVGHQLICCEAFRNIGRGIDLNSNPGAMIKDCNSHDNLTEDNYREEGLQVYSEEMKKCDQSKNILFLISSLSNGGAERVTVNLANYLSRSHKVTICYFNDKPHPYPVDERVTLIKVPQKHIVQKTNPVYQAARSMQKKLWFRKMLSRCKSLFFSKRIPFVRRVKKTLKPDVTVSMLSSPNEVNAKLQGGLRIMSERNDPCSKPGKYYQSSLRCYRKADRVIFQTQTVKNMYPEYIRRKGIVIKNPVSVEAVEYRPDSKKIVSVGRLNAQKNYPMLLKAFAKFLEKHPDYELHIYGEGEERKKLENLIKDLRLDRNVVLEGFVSDIHRQIGDAVLFVMSSDFEGLPNALMEAMMMGLPVVATRCNGVPELIRDGINGLSVPVGDADRMEQAMESMVEDRELRLRLREQAMADAEEFRTERVMAAWEAAICSDR